MSCLNGLGALSSNHAYTDVSTIDSKANDKASPSSCIQTALPQAANQVSSPKSQIELTSSNPAITEQLKILAHSTFKLSSPSNTSGRDTEIAIYQQLVQSLYKEDASSYDQLAQLIQKGFSTALLIFLGFEIPNFYSNLAKAISWDKISFKTLRTLDSVELLAHYNELKFILEHSNQKWPYATESELNSRIDKLYTITRMECWNAENKQFFLPLDDENSKASRDLWNAMAEVLYPRSHYNVEFHSKTSSIMLIKVTPLSL